MNKIKHGFKCTNPNCWCRSLDKIYTDDWKILQKELLKKLARK